MAEENIPISPRTRCVSNLHALNISVEGDIFICQDYSHLEVAWFLVVNDPQLNIAMLNGVWPTYNDLTSTYEVVADYDKIKVLRNKRTRAILLVYGQSHTAIEKFNHYNSKSYVAMEKSLKPNPPAIKFVRDLAKPLKNLDPRASEEQRNRLIASILIDYIFDYNDPL